MSAAFDRIMADPHLARARRKLSADEIMTIIRHVWAATGNDTCMIGVNGKRVEWPKLTISHSEICEIADQPVHASVTYSYRVNGQTLSGMTFGDKSVSVFPNMQFDCVVTGNA